MVADEKVPCIKEHCALLKRSVAHPSLEVLDSSTFNRVCDSTMKPFKEIDIAHVLGRINGSPNLVVIENSPSAIFEDVSNIVTTLRRCSNVTNNTNKSISCEMPKTGENKLSK